MSLIGDLNNLSDSQYIIPSMNLSSIQNELNSYPPLNGSYVCSKYLPELMSKAFEELLNFTN